MNDLKLKLSQQKVQTIAQRYQTNLSSPKSSFIKSSSLQRSQQLMQNMSSMQNNQQEELSFIPNPGANTNSTDYINLWKDFRNDVRKKIETVQTTSRVNGSSTSRGRDLSANGASFTSGLGSTFKSKVLGGGNNQNSRKNYFDQDTSQVSMLSNQQHQNSQSSSQYNSLTVRNSFMSNPIAGPKKSILIQNQADQNLETLSQQQNRLNTQPAIQNQNDDLRIEYDLKRASKIQDMFQKYLKDDAAISNNNANYRFEDQRNSIKNQTQNASSYLRNSPGRSNAQPRQSSLMNRSPQSQRLGHKRDKSANLNQQNMNFSGNNKLQQMADTRQQASSQLRERNYDQKLERESIIPGSIHSNFMQAQSTPYTPKRNNNLQFYESLNQNKAQQSPLTGKNLMNNLEQKMNSQLLKSPLQSSQKKNYGNTTIADLSAITQKFQNNNLLSSGVTHNKSPRVSFSISQFSKQYRKEDIQSLRQTLSNLNMDEAESLPFGLQNELIRLAEVINEKLGQTNQRQVLNSFK